MKAWVFEHTSLFHVISQKLLNYCKPVLVDGFPSLIMVWTQWLLGESPFCIFLFFFGCIRKHTPSPIIRVLLYGKIYQHIYTNTARRFEPFNSPLALMSISFFAALKIPTDTISYIPYISHIYPKKLMGT